MDVDPEEDSEFLEAFVPAGDEPLPEERIQVVESTTEWTQMRETMAVDIFEEWRALRGSSEEVLHTREAISDVRKAWPDLGKDRATGSAAVSGFDAEE
ncbi:hypothetical protein PIB30_029747 [Stylosanthes scabra]|uniref:Uncharacterized protein n=1 Tax=Stylosanthes scabra TaxID=79078 RepID=A0ABU6ZB71_9FABA|nr:hypothetical protein [Stylosanthes scabra]